MASQKSYGVLVFMSMKIHDYCSIRPEVWQLLNAQSNHKRNIKAWWTSRHYTGSGVFSIIIIGQTWSLLKYQLLAFKFGVWMMNLNAWGLSLKHSVLILCLRLYYWDLMYFILLSFSLICWKYMLFMKCCKPLWYQIKGAAICQEIEIPLFFDCIILLD